ncbi:hypothetical protein J18TS1_24010 [Oceanobacillus oncorhynchi subsp. incaldanensis]|uniref:Uncharacterized protein n=1 Tax=Oceanobacillus oncorhynchi TaxID=545501 RepID=A0A0A1MHQ7_9BACI|nr:hypothetical protein [Oceanobacillus oncorhynchi]GIO19301.1 hypothetical protein J18TS1_24010 [Oceanobacillus oncorhynchi subsp. incaldanensis]CEI82623.1 hypothetical protein BN997_02506 [Oceanobacillus oncorhynchi]
MDNHLTDNTARRYKAHVSVLGTTQLHLRSPSIIAWWSAAYPGFGHLLLSKYLRGFVLFIWEVFINLNANINLAILYSFQGKFEMATNVLDSRWLLAYLPVYFFAIWDSHRTTVDMNKVYMLAEREDHHFNLFSIGLMEINYLDKRNPMMAAIWSAFVPGLGQLYIHRLVTALFVISWTVIFLYLSHLLEAVTLLISGDLSQSTAVLREEFLLMLPSIYGFAIYDAYVNTVENNKLFEKEQRRFLKDNYQDSNFQILKGEKVNE